MTHLVKKFLGFYETPELHYLVQKILQWSCFLSHVKSANILFLKINLNVILLCPARLFEQFLLFRVLDKEFVCIYDVYK